MVPFKKHPFYNIHLKLSTSQDFFDGPVVKTVHFWSLIGELRSYMLHCMAKKTRNKQTNKKDKAVNFSQSTREGMQDSLLQ